MNAVDPVYVEARRVLLDALGALAPHAPALVLAGAQAVYLHTRDGNLAVAPYTTDGELAVDPAGLAATPEIEAAMKGAGFALSTEPGIWVACAVVNGEPVTIPVDLIVPEGFAAPGGRRGARLGPHGNKAARRAVGFEAALVDKTPMTITALDRADSRSVTVDVAGVAALLVAKAHKLHDRVEKGRSDRLDDKDALDVFRMMQLGNARGVGATVAELASHVIAGTPTRQAVGYLSELFGRRGSAGIRMAARALGAEISEELVEAVCVAYVAAVTATTSNM